MRAGRLAYKKQTKVLSSLIKHPGKKMNEILESYLNIRRYKERLFEKQSRNLKVHVSPEVELQKQPVYEMNGDGTAYGYIEDDLNASDMIMNYIGMAKPKHLIMGDMSFEDLRYFDHLGLYHYFPPTINPIENSSLFATKQLNSFLSTIDDRFEYLRDLGDTEHLTISLNDTVLR